MDNIKLQESLKLNLGWFENSGVMDPADGSWGVAERIVLKKDNGVLEKIFKSFPSYLEYEDYAVIEHRRPDCNFESALMFLLANGESNIVARSRSFALLPFLTSSTSASRSS